VGSVAVVTDSTADFAGVHAADLGITIVPLTVNWGRDVLRDRIDLSTAEFYTRLRIDKELPKTAAPPPGIFEEVYRNLLESHDSVISIHITSKFSATWGVASNVARSVSSDHIHVIDSGTVSIPLGWCAERAATLGREGVPADGIVRELESMIPRLRIYVTLDTLEYLQRGGRIGRARAFLGALLNVKPILFCQDGEIHPIERVRTRQAALRRMAALVAASGPVRIAVAHGDAPEDAESVRNHLGSLERSGPVPITELGTVLGTHTGPGVVGVGLLLAS
jgi:DegV family protein with EDD domain